MHIILPLGDDGSQTPTPANPTSSAPSDPTSSTLHSGGQESQESTATSLPVGGAAPYQQSSDPSNQYPSSSANMTASYQQSQYSGGQGQGSAMTAEQHDMPSQQSHGYSVGGVLDSSQQQQVTRLASCTAHAVHTCMYMYVHVCSISLVCMSLW